MLKSALADADEALQHAEKELADTSKALRKEKKKVSALQEEHERMGGRKIRLDEQEEYVAIEDVTQSILEAYGTLCDHYTSVMEAALGDNKLFRKMISRAPLPLSFMSDVESTISKIVNQRSPDEEDQGFHQMNQMCEKVFVSLRELLGEIQNADGSADILESSGERQRASPLNSPLVNSRPGSRGGSRKGSPRV